MSTTLTETYTHQCDRCGYEFSDARDAPPEGWTRLGQAMVGAWDLCETCSDEFTVWFESGVASRRADV